MGDGKAPGSHRGLPPELLEDASRRAIHYLAGSCERRVAPPAEAVAALEHLGGPLPEAPGDPAEVLRLLDEYGSPATVASAGPRYFGFVIGGSLPATVAGSWLAAAWDQNAGMVAASPVAAALEEIALGWLVDLLGLPEGTAGGFVTGATMANFAGLAAARHALLRRRGWDVEAEGLPGAPPLRVVVGDEVHVSVLKALSMLGLGRDRVIRVPVDDQGRLVPAELPLLAADTIVCLQAGNVNSGAFDPAAEVCEVAAEAEAWVHVDGAFGLWALACPGRADQWAGYPAADSWATDAHKWLNAPYDSGLVFCRDAESLRRAFAATAAYLMEGGTREPDYYTPEMSRRARGVEIWAALKSLGRQGLADLVERTCHLAEHFADRLEEAGFEILNDVVANQVLVSFGDADTTRRVIAGVQEEGTCWCGGTSWQGRAAMRISVSSWMTTEEDVHRSADAIIQVARTMGAA